MSSRSNSLGIDFGTSNSAAGFMQSGKPRLIEMEPGEKTIPSTFFFDFDSRKTLIGEPANQALLEGLDGRFMRALKRVLGTSLMHEKRQILNERTTFVEIIARFLAEIKLRAEKQTGLTFETVLSGRPVFFHGQNDAREQQAEDDLRACYLAAGFRNVDFMFEPEAAAIASGALDESGETGLIVDIGGGTSDFTVFRSDKSGVSILANHGIRFGGTDFDRAISIDQVMPHFGKGTLLRKTIGPGTTPAPAAIFVDLATWEKIPFLYTAQSRRMVKELVQVALEPALFSRLLTVLEDELGHDLAFEVEKGKMAANRGIEGAAIKLDHFETGLNCPVSAAIIADILGDFATGLSSASSETLRLAGVPPHRLDRVIYVGGSSLMAMVSDRMRMEFPNADHSFTEVFTAVADGLAIAANRG